MCTIRVFQVAKYSRKDTRWKDRKEGWEIAVRYHQKYTNNNVKPQTILELAKAKGFWSVWMIVFSDSPQIKRLLIEQFTGTALCFDDEGNSLT